MRSLRFEALAPSFSQSQGEFAYLLSHGEKIKAAI